MPDTSDVNQNRQPTDWNRSAQARKIAIVFWFTFLSVLIFGPAVVFCAADAVFAWVLLLLLGGVVAVASIYMFFDAGPSKRTSGWKLMLHGLAVLTPVLAIAVMFLSESFIKFRLPITSEENWPKPLRSLLEDADQRKINVGEIDVYCVSKGLLDEYYWRTDAAPGLLARMVARWGLSPMARDNALVRRSWTSMPFALYWSSNSVDVEYFAKWGGKGDNYLVMDDRTRKRIVVRYMYNF
jgi:hypothetical protein